MHVLGQGRALPLFPYTPESWEEQVSHGPSMHLPDASVLAVPSGASAAFKESSGQADTMGSAVGRGGSAFFSQRQSPLCPPASIS